MQIGSHACSSTRSPWRSRASHGTGSLPKPLSPAELTSSRGTTYVRASLHEVATALVALTGELYLTQFPALTICRSPWPVTSSLTITWTERNLCGASLLVKGKSS